jgi:hypothetical protein
MVADRLVDEGVDLPGPEQAPPRAGDVGAGLERLRGAAGVRARQSFCGIARDGWRGRLLKIGTNGATGHSRCGERRRHPSGAAANRWGARVSQRRTRAGAAAE